MAYIGRQNLGGAYRQLDDISSGFDGSDTTHTMQVNSANVTVGDVNQIILSLGGVIQKPGTDFTVSGSVLTFTTAPAANTSFFAVLLGSDNGGTVTPTDGSVTGDKLASNISITTTGTTSLDGAVTINESSADVDFRVESNNRSSMLHVNAGTDTVLIGTDTTSDEFYNADGTYVPGFQTFGTSNTAGRISSFNYGSADSGGPIVILSKNRNTTSASHTVVQADDQIGNISFQGSDGTTYIEGASIRSFVESGVGGDDVPAYLAFLTNTGSTGATEAVRISGQYSALMVNKTSQDNSTGSVLNDANGLYCVVSGAAVLTANRLANDGIIIQLNQASSQEGNISVSGSTVSYNAFTGSHWSRLADNSKPTILRGTIMESLDTKMDWYQVRKDVAEVKYTADDQEVKDGEKKVGDTKKKPHTAVESIALPDGKSVGDSMDFTSNDVNYTGTIVKEDDVKHVKCKISDTADSKKVYGLFHCWDDADDGQDGDVNDMEIAQVGTYIIRVNKDVTVEAGDLLVSNGDGTAKVQDDDIIRSKTVAKVNSNVKVETYSDGSYTVPCTLHC